MPSQIEVLNLSKNFITGLHSIFSNLKKIQNLDVSNNKIFDFLHISCGNSLKVLNAEYNYLSTLQGLESFINLVELNVRHNLLSTTESISYLNCIENLNFVNLEENPVVE